jgi:hypothetical protein
MSYLGNTPETYNFSAGADRFSGNASATVFTLSRRVTSANDVIAVIESVPQDPFSAYTIAANNTSGTSDITFTSAPPSGTNNIYVSFRATQLVTFNQVTASQIVPTGVSAGIYGGSSAIPVIQVNAQGQVTSASNTSLNLNAITGDLTVTGNVTVSTTRYFLPAKGTTAQRPGTAVAGMIRFNTTTAYMEYYDGAQWASIAAPYSVEYLIIAGGGGSGGESSGGGGAGGLVYGTGSMQPGFSYTTTVGAGGTAYANGTDSSITGSSWSSTTAVGGGKSGGSNSGGASSGGSGGGGGWINSSAGSGTSGQGNNGGAGSAGGARHGGGGGGASASGAACTNNDNNANGAGGSGTNSYSTWASATSTGSGGYYAGGGAGGGEYYNTSNSLQKTVSSTGGAGGGGNGCFGSTPNTGGSNGTTNTGGGGGGQCGNSSTGLNGGSGIVIIRYAAAAQKGTNGTVTSSGGYYYHTFTSSGTYTA